MVYISTKNFNYPKGFPKKFIPKYEGPYKITEDYGNSSFHISISQNMKRQGIHDMFHAALLRIHKLNDDRLFPGRLDEQIVKPKVNGWATEHVVVHHGTKSNAMYEVLWATRDKSWMTNEEVEELNLLIPYLELLGLEKIEDLVDKGTGQPPMDDHQVFLVQIPFQNYLGDKLGGKALKPSLELDLPINNLTICMGHPNPYGNCRSPEEGEAIPGITLS
ncbi:hypothetical protein J132_07996 [Termitomyces sp. J132]|nr:hypothetical protein J132_07996 [Termitomyces sp. J132]